jgi:hypothetical protein
MVVGAVGCVIVDVGVEEVVLPVELEEAVEFEVDIGCVVVNTDEAMSVLPPVINVERNVDVMTVNDVEDGEDDDDEFVAF